MKDHVTGLMTKHGADVVSAKLWEERRLAYPIKHQQRGTYLLVYMNVDTNELGAINRDLNLSEPVLRHLTTVCEELPENIDEPEAEFDASAVVVEDVSGPAPEPKEPDPEESESDEGAEATEAKAEDKQADAAEGEADEAKAAGEEGKSEEAAPAADAETKKEED